MCVCVCVLVYVCASRTILNHVKLESRFFKLFAAWAMLRRAARLHASVVYKGCQRSSLLFHLNLLFSLYGVLQMHPHFSLVTVKWPLGYFVYNQMWGKICTQGEDMQDKKWKYVRLSLYLTKMYSIFPL